jgi:SAM-dependent methyltransferase
MAAEDESGPGSPEYTHFTDPAPPPAGESSDSDWSEPTIVSHQLPAAEPAALPFENAAPAQHRTQPDPPPYQHAPATTPVDALPPDLIPYQPESQAAEPQPAPQPAVDIAAEPPAAEPVSQPELEPAQQPVSHAEHEPEPEPEPERLHQLRPPPPPARTSTPPPPPMRPSRARIAYDRGSVGDDHAKLVEQAADVAVAAMPIPLRVLDVGCGDGKLLAELILRVPYAELYVGVDPIPGVMPDVQLDSDPRLCLVRAAAESLPFPDSCFDLVITTMSFAYWKDQRKGIAELGRVVARTGKVVLVEPTGGDAKGKGRLHGEKDISYVLERAGLELEHTETVGRSRMGKAQARAFIAIP